MFAGRDEEAAAHVFSFDCNGFRVYFCQCRCARAASARSADRLIDYVGAEVCDLVHCVSVENCEEAEYEQFW